jgi:hypothetical protein
LLHGLFNGRARALQPNLKTVECPVTSPHTSEKEHLVRNHPHRQTINRSRGRPTSGTLYLWFVAFSDVGCHRLKDVENCVQTLYERGS